MGKNKEKKISINQLERVMNETHVAKKIVEWNGLEVVINTSLGLYDVVEIADSVVRSCFDQESGVYHPELKDFVLRKNIVEKYSNLTLPKNLESQYNILINSGAVEMILEHINHDQYYELEEAVSNRLNVAANASLHAIYKQIEEVTSALSSFDAGMSDLFSGVSPESFSAVMNSFADGGIDEEKLVEAYAKTLKASDE